jgi:hypothetical protein
MSGVGVATAAVIGLGTSLPALAAVPPPSPAAARLQGQFLLAGRVTAADNVRGVRVGQSVLRKWTFAPRCALGACATVGLVRERRGGTDRLVLHRRSPAYYVGSGAFYAPLNCGGRTYKRGQLVPFTITVRVTAAKAVTVGVVATRVRASYTNRGRTNLTPCVMAPAHDAASYHGHLL